MIRTGTFAAFATIFLTTAAPAQTAPRFRWQPGQVLTYRVAQVTSASETSDGNSVATSTKLNETKRWQVLAVDAAGTATLQLSLAALRVETTTPKGDAILFDSANLDKSDPAMREQLGRFLGQPLAVLRVDAQGKVVEVKECKYGPASRFESEPPFVVVLPTAPPQTAPTWERSYQVTLEPPQGTGEKYDAVQKYVCKAATPTALTCSVTTLIPKPPAALADQIPLLQMQPEGEIVFDLQSGRLQTARLVIDKELKNYQGDGSCYHFQSSYIEEYVATP
jgi:hypothetical protein